MTNSLKLVLLLCTMCAASGPGSDALQNSQPPSATASPLSLEDPIISRQVCNFLGSKGTGTWQSANKQSKADIQGFAAENAENASTRNEHLRWGLSTNACPTDQGLKTLVALFMRGRSGSAELDALRHLRVAVDSFVRKSGENMSRKLRYLQLTITDLLLQLANNSLSEISTVDSDTCRERLSLAVQADCIEIVQFLLKNGADVNVRDMYRWTPLHYAVSTGNVEIVELLLKQKADVNHKDHEQRTPLTIAIEANHAKPLNVSTKAKIVKLLLFAVAKTVAEVMKLNIATEANHAEIAEPLVDEEVVAEAVARTVAEIMELIT